MFFRYGFFCIFGQLKLNIMDILKHNGLEFEDMHYSKEDLLNVLRLQKQLLIKEDVLYTIQECINIWQQYSWDLCASWLFFPDKDEDILNYIERSDVFTSFKDYSK